MEQNPPTPEVKPAFNDLADELRKAPAALRGLVLDVMVENYPNAPAALLDGSGVSAVEAQNDAVYVSHDD